MGQDITFARGVGRACLAAGPVFLATVALLTSLSAPQPVEVGADLFGSLLLLIPAVLVGGPLALLPNLVGTAVLASAASANIGLRLPALWAIVGGLVAGMGATVMDTDRITIAAFAATGAICALLCRSGTRWQN